jgi:hypothetical protein
LLIGVLNARRAAMTSRLKWILMVGAAVALIAVGGGVASGVSGGGSGEVDDGRDDTPVTGSQSDDIRAAALKATGGGRVLEAEPDGDPGGDGDRGERDDADSPDEGAQGGADNERDYAYEVTVEQPDGKVVEVQLDKDLKAHGTDTED